MRQRLIELLNRFTNERTKYKEFEELTGIKRTAVKALYEGRQRFNEEHIEAICAAFPQYKIWFVFGETHPEIGQISPELEQVADDFRETGTDT